MTRADELRQAARREAARRRLLRFTHYTFKGNYRENFHHARICEALEAVARYEIPRLLIVAPPRHGKSELVSRRFPAWYLGNNPHRQIIAATYGQDLSDRMSRDVKRIRESDEYQELFPEAPGYGEMNKVAEWNLAEGGVYKGVGVGGPVTGFGANILLIDDPVKNREEAESETLRNKTWEWFNNDVMTRLEAPNAVVVMATRWHEDDLIGRILNSPTADDWVILHLPRIQDSEPTAADPRAPGAPLWPGRLMLPWERCEALDNWPENSEAASEAAKDVDPETEDDEFAVEYEAPAARVFDPSEYAGGDPFFTDSDELGEDEKVEVELETLVARDIRHFETFEKNDPYGAAALEQGTPTPRGGTIVDPEAINTYLGSPAVRAMHCPQLVISIDANFKKTKTSDFASCTVFGRTTRPNAIYVIDEAHGRFSYPELKRAVKRLAREYPRAALLIEAKANGQALIDELRGGGFARVIEFEPSKHGSKEVRAQIAAEFISGGGLFVPAPKQAPFINAWLEEVTKFGVAAHDDRMDSLSQAVIHWAGRRTGLDHLRRITGITGTG